jgi:hypothetical protein
MTNLALAAVACPAFVLIDHHHTVATLHLMSGLPFVNLPASRPTVLHWIKREDIGLSSSCEARSAHIATPRIEPTVWGR